MKHNISHLVDQASLLITMKPKS